MTEAERIARAQRAEAAWNEFIAIPIEEMIGEYQSRMVEIANGELDAKKRCDKLTALSNAIRITENLRHGLQAIIKDGEIAHREMIRADKVENMTAPARRLLGVVPY